MKSMMKITKRNVIMFFVLLVLGFLLTYSYQKVKQREDEGLLSEQHWNQEYNYKKILTDIEKTNNDLQQELQEKQEQVKEIESSLASSEERLSEEVEEVSVYRQLLGKVSVKGEGVVITINDAKNAEKNNEEDYIVHDGQIQMLINELYITGAESISINGQIITRFSSIICVGPTITVDGMTQTAPFVVSAIGNQNTIYTGVTLSGGIIDMLLNNNLEVSVEKEEEITMKPSIHEE